MRSVWLLALCAPIACGRTASSDGPDSSGAASSAGGGGLVAGNGGSSNGGASPAGPAGAAMAAGGDGGVFPPGTEPLAIAWQIAGRARGEALCRCAQPDAVDVQSCVDEETFAPNAICLSALTTPDAEAWHCRTEALRAEAECYARGPCSSGGTLPSCPQAACPEPFPSVHAARYCHQRNCVGLGGAKYSPAKSAMASPTVRTERMS